MLDENTGFDLVAVLSARARATLSTDLAILQQFFDIKLRWMLGHGVDLVGVDNMEPRPCG
jgi:hypothetical protein